MFITAYNECGNSPPNSQYTKYVYTQKPRYQTLHGAIWGAHPYASLDLPLPPVGSGAKPQPIEPKILVA